MKVFTPGLDKSRPIHALAAICILPRNVLPQQPIKRFTVKLSNGKKVKVGLCIHSGESIKELGDSIKKDISSCVKLAQMVHCSR